MMITLVRTKTIPNDEGEETQKLYIYTVGEHKVTKEEALREKPGRQHGSWVEVLASSSVRQARICGVSFCPLLAVQTGMS